MEKKDNYLSKKISELEKELELLKSVDNEEEYFKKKSKDRQTYRKNQFKESKEKSMDTVGVWGLYGKKDMNEYKSYIPPVYASTAGPPFPSLKFGELLLSYQITDEPIKQYSRYDNVTFDHLARKIAAMEGINIPETPQGLCTSSGMSAIFLATMQFLMPRDNFVACNRIYGGTQQLFDVTYQKMGWESRWVQQFQDSDKWREKIDEDTKFLFVEFPSNPTLNCPDIPKIANVAHEHDIPLIVDSTIASPVLTRPLEHGADVVVLSLTKIMCGSARTIGGAIVSKEEIVADYTGPKWSEIQHNFVDKLFQSHFRNTGPCMSPYAAKDIWDELITLKVRLKEISRKAMKITRFLQDHPKIEAVSYPGLASHPQHEIAKKLMKLPNGENAYGHLMSFQVKGGLEAAKKFAQEFDFGAQVGDLGQNYTVWVHPATTTHGQMKAKKRREAGVADNMIRYSVGLEGTEDAIKAFNKALQKV